MEYHKDFCSSSINVGDTDLHHVSNDQVRAGGHTEGVAVNDLRCDPATVDERLDRPPGLHTEQTEDRQRLSFIDE